MSDNASARPYYYKDASVQVLLAMVLGVVLGHFAPNLAMQMKPLGDIFLRLIRMAIGPVIFLTVVTGISGMGDMKKVGKVGGAALIYFEVLSTIALATGMVLGNLLKPGLGMHATATGKVTDEVTKLVAHGTHGFSDFLLGIVPENVVQSFVAGNLIQIVFFSVLFGIALSATGEAGKPVERLLQQLSAAFFRLIDLVMKYAPIGAFGALAFTIGRYGLGAVGTLGLFVMYVYVAYAVFIAVVMGLTARLAGISLWRMIRYLREEILLVAGTSSSESVLLPSMEKLERLGCSRAVVGLVMPTGYSFNLDGAAIYLSMAVLFIAQAYDVPLDIWQQISILAILVLTSKGGAGVAGAALVVLGATLASTKVLPVEGLALLFGIDRIVNIGRAVTNLIGNALATIVVARWTGDFDAARGLTTYRSFFKKPDLARV